MDDEFDSQPVQPRPRNQATRRQHRRESWWQIGLPLILGILLVASPVVWVVASGKGEIGSLAQIATMLLAVVGLFMGLLVLVFTGVMIYALARLMNWLPPQAFRLQKLIRILDNRLEQAADLAARPMILLNSWGKAAQQILRRRN